MTRSDLGVCSQNGSTVGSVASAAVDQQTASDSFKFKLFLDTNAKSPALSICTKEILPLTNYLTTISESYT